MNGLRVLREGPTVAVLYVLVYWGRTLFVVLLTLQFACTAFVHSRWGLLPGAFALLVSGFNLGMAVGIDGPPPGRRR